MVNPALIMLCLFSSWTSTGAGGWTVTPGESESGLGTTVTVVLVRD
jgi:hypothetical protein